MILTIFANTIYVTRERNENGILKWNVFTVKLYVVYIQRQNMFKQVYFYTTIKTGNKEHGTGFKFKVIKEMREK